MRQNITISDQLSKIHLKCIYFLKLIKHTYEKKALSSQPWQPCWRCRALHRPISAPSPTMKPSQPPKLKTSSCSWTSIPIGVAHAK